MTPGITVVTVAYNDLDRLVETVASVTAQVGVDLQHVIVDGASTDGTQQWLAESARHATVVSEPDRGIFDAMNKGIALADGELITFLNAGDAYLRTTVLLDVLESFARHQWQWAYARARVVDEEGRPYRPVVGMPVYRFRSHAWRLNPINHQATYASTSAIRDLHGYSLGMGNAADFHLLLQLGRRYQPAVLGTIDVRYLAGGISEREGRNQLRLKHRARVDVLRHGRTASTVDSVLTEAQVGYLLARRAAKKAATTLRTRRLLQWWAGRGDELA
jgi:glycosyltransferase involved in cell wall biosynthesis